MINLMWNFMTDPLWPCVIWNRKMKGTCDSVCNLSNNSDDSSFVLVFFSQCCFTIWSSAAAGGMCICDKVDFPAAADFWTLPRRAKPFNLLWVIDLLKLSWFVMGESWICVQKMKLWVSWWTEAVIKVVKFKFSGVGTAHLVMGKKGTTRLSHFQILIKELLVAEVSEFWIDLSMRLEPRATSMSGSLNSYIYLSLRYLHEQLVTWV